MTLDELLAREGVDGKSLVAWAHERVATILADLSPESELHRLLHAAGEGSAASVREDAASVREDSEEIELLDGDDLEILEVEPEGVADDDSGSRTFDRAVDDGHG